VVDLVLVALALGDLHQYVELHSSFLPHDTCTPVDGRDGASLAALCPNGTSKGA
jgi:hypothetical protein